MPVPFLSPCVFRARSVVAALVAALLIATAAAQELPADAQTALRTAQRSAAEALATYDRHSPDRPLWSEALAAGAAAAEAAPDHPAPRRFLGQAYLQVGWYARSWNAWQAYLDTGGAVDAVVERQLVEVAEWMGVNAFTRGIPADAIRYFETVLRYRPDHLTANDRLARIYLDRGEPSNALPYLDVLDGRVPELETARQRLLRVQRFGAEAVDAFDAGVEARATGASGAALERFRRVTTLAPEYTEAWRATGELAEDLGRLDVARDAYGELVRRDARDAGALAGLGRLALAEDDFEAAVGWFERAVAAAPDASAYADAWAASQRLLEEGRAAEEEAARAAEEAEARAQAEAQAEAQAAAQAEAQTEAEAAAARQAAEEEAARVAAEQEAARQAAEERATDQEAARQAELAAQRQAEEEAAARAAAQAQVEAEAARRAAEEEAARLAAEEEADRRAAEAREDAEAQPRVAETSLELVDATVRHRRDGGTPSPSVVFVAAPELAIDLSARTGDTVHVRLDVDVKPSDAPVEYQLCLVPADVTIRPACTDPGLLSFAAAGVYETTTRWSDLVGAGDVDWRTGVDSVMLILRRPDGAAVDAPTAAGNDLDLDRYLPMTVHVQVLAVPTGAGFPGWP